MVAAKALLVPELAPAVVAVYLRVSSAEQHEENQAPDVERLIAARYPQAEVLMFREKRSATKGKRPVFDRLMADARAGKFSVLVVWKLDRFGRSMAGNVRDVLALDALGVRLVSVVDGWLDTQGPTRNLMLPIFSWVAEQECVTMRERVARGVTRVREQGGAITGPGFGVKLVRDKVEGIARKVLNDSARPTCLRIAELFIATKSLRGTSRRLSADMASGRADLLPPSKRNRQWNANMIKRVVQSEDLRALGCWAAELVAQLDAALSECEHQAPTGAATPVHLAASFLACGVCGGAVTIRNKGAQAVYQCARFVKRGKLACPGIGGRKKLLVEQALTSIVRPAIDGELKRQALALAREKLSARANVPSERDAVAAALEEAVREGLALVRLGRAAGKDDKIDALVSELKENNKTQRQLRDRLARLEASPTASLDGRRKLAEVERRLDELAKALDEGGIAARPAVQAVLQGARLRVTPVIVGGERRWAIHGRIPAAYITTLDETVQRCNESPTRTTPSA